MPWSEVDEATGLSLLDLPGTHFVLFYASGNPPWCSDCRNATQALEEVFGPDDAPPLNVIRVGTEEQWRKDDNIWRTSAYHAGETPLLIKLIDGKEVSRLGEKDCKYVEDLKRLL